MDALELENKKLKIALRLALRALDSVCRAFSEPKADLEAEKRSLLHAYEQARSALHGFDVSAAITPDWFLMHETSYIGPARQGDPWAWKCSCGKTGYYETYQDCHRATREHWCEEMDKYPDVLSGV